MTPIFLIAGSPGVGKTTIGRALAGKFAKGVHIPVDAIREMVTSGLVTPRDGWSPQLIEQLQLARETVSAMAYRYQQSGFAVTIDDFWDTYSRLLEYQSLMDSPSLHKILLYPNKEAALARESNRHKAGERAYSLAGAVELVYGQLATDIDYLKAQGWLVVDSSEQSVEETVSEILERTGHQRSAETPYSTEKRRYRR